MVLTKTRLLKHDFPVHGKSGKKEKKRKKRNSGSGPLKPEKAENTEKTENPALRVTREKERNMNSGIRYGIFGCNRTEFRNKVPNCWHEGPDWKRETEPKKGPVLKGHVWGAWSISGLCGSNNIKVENLSPLLFSWVLFCPTFRAKSKRLVFFLLFPWLFPYSLTGFQSISANFWVSIDLSLLLSFSITLSHFQSLSSHIHSLWLSQKMQDSTTEGAGRSTLWTNTGQDWNFQRTLRAIGPYEFRGNQSLVHTFSWGNSYGPMVLKVLLKFPPALALVHGWLFPKVGKIWLNLRAEKPFVLHASALDWSSNKEVLRRLSIQPLVHLPSVSWKATWLSPKARAYGALVNSRWNDNSRENTTFVWREKKPTKKNHIKEFGGRDAPEASQGQTRDVPGTNSGHLGLIYV